MDELVVEALRNDRVIDITTLGRKTGLPRRIEIGLVNLGDMFVISGHPGRPRSWYANLLANPKFTLHVKGTAQADLQAKATPIRDTHRRRAVFIQAAAMGRYRRGETEMDVEEWVNKAPLVHVEILA
jgi:deazaflavin-dependent oxidoreductase (nitroreductase family)